MRSLEFHPKDGLGQGPSYCGKHGQAAMLQLRLVSKQSSETTLGIPLKKKQFHQLYHAIGTKTYIFRGFYGRVFRWPRPLFFHGLLGAHSINQEVDVILILGPIL